MFGVKVVRIGFGFSNISRNNLSIFTVRFCVLERGLESRGSSYL